MPIYEYKCTKCGYRFDMLQKFSDTPISLCPKCNGSVKKLVSHSSFQLKGSGWYLTDYARKGSPSPSSESTSKPKGHKEKNKTKKSKD